MTISFPLFRHVLCEKKDLEIHKRLTHTTTEACHFLCIKRHHNIALFIFGHNIPNRMLGNIPPQSFGWTLMNWGSTWGLRASTMCHIFPSIHLLDFFVFVTPQWSCGSFCDTLWVIIMVHRPNLIDYFDLSCINDVSSVPLQVLGLRCMYFQQLFYVWLTRMLWFILTQYSCSGCIYIMIWINLHQGFPINSNKYVLFFLQFLEWET